ncbi:MAG: zinc/iron-chelating domain-containing protein [Acidobacteria bacterium]|nr:MAG: zinc/iron-chelating domain-containing protein [Acidobacteriota bacterium]
MRCKRPNRDNELVQIVDVALIDVARRAGEWLVCRPGCAQCCIGAFAINALDAARLREGFTELKRTDPDRANRVRLRAKAYIQRVASQFPGDPKLGILHESENAQERFLSFADDEVCPALDPQSGACDLYQYRPMTCRVFGPPVRNEGGGLGICELCFHGASDDEIASCEMRPDPEHLEDSLLAELTDSGESGSTIVAYVLAN